MALANVELVAATIALASGLAIAALGVLSLLGGRARPRGALGLGLFALAWGSHITFGNVARLVESVAVAEQLLLLALVSLFPLAYFLVEFTRGQVGDAVDPRVWTVARFLTGGVAVAAPLLFILQPDLFLQAVTADEVGILATWGPAYTVLQWTFFSALGFSLLSLTWAFLEAPTERIHKRLAVLLGGLGLYVGFASGHFLSFYGSWAIVYGPTTDNVSFGVLFAGLAAVSVYVVSRLLAAARHASAQPEARRARWLAAGISVPLLWGLVEGRLALDIIHSFQTVGLWRLIGVALVVYGVASWRLYDLPQRTRKVAASTAGTGGAATVGGLAAYATATTLSSGLALSFLVGAGAFTAVVRPALRYAQRIFGDERQSEAVEDEAYGQRLDTYRAALEASMARGTLEQDEAFLAALRERFGISEDVDRAFRHLARQAVLLPRDPGDTDAYERLRLLGEGGAGRTWLARDRTRDRLVVLKEPLARWQEEQALQERVLREARAAARVDHPNVVRVHEVVRHRGQPVIVMEYVDGGSLEGLLRSQGVLPWQHAARILRDALEGLEAVHGAGLVHRDVKPANILLTGEGQAKLADFGIATGGPSKDTLVAPEEGRPGTRTYQAPEVAAGQQVEDARTDIYSAAAVLHECLYGSPPDHPVTAENPVPQPVQTVLHRGLAADPGKRFQSAGAFARALDEVISS